jgi:glycine cleavage system pyridoxal-binding protein P|tara:strand:+ start:96 stop:536 length:441 start_codon:yes stop_codon:yes gene_type:complete
MAMNLDVKRQMMKTIGEALIAGASNLDDDEAAEVGVVMAKLIRQKQKLTILVLKECFIQKNPVLRKCLVIKEQECLAEMLEWAESACETGVLKETNYINLSNVWKTEYESLMCLAEMFGDINKIDNTLIANMWTRATEGGYNDLYN